MGIEKNIEKEEENLSEKYDKLRQEKMERIYKREYKNTILAYMMLGMVVGGR